MKSLAALIKDRQKWLGEEVCDFPHLNYQLVGYLEDEPSALAWVKAGGFVIPGTCTYTGTNAAEVPPIPRRRITMISRIVEIDPQDLDDFLSGP